MYITFALVDDVAVEFGHNVASRVFHEGLVDELFIVVGPLLLPESAKTSGRKTARMTRQLHPRRSTVLQQHIAGRCCQVQCILHKFKKSKEKHNHNLSKCCLNTSATQSRSALRHFMFTAMKIYFLRYKCFSNIKKTGTVRTWREKKKSPVQNQHFYIDIF